MGAPPRNPADPDRDDRRHDGAKGGTGDHPLGSRAGRQWLFCEYRAGPTRLLPSPPRHRMPPGDPSCGWRGAEVARTSLSMRGNTAFPIAFIQHAVFPQTAAKRATTTAIEGRSNPPRSDLGELNGRSISGGRFAIA